MSAAHALGRLWALWRAIAGATFGAGLSSLATRASAEGLPSFGPRAIELFGLPVPIMSALFGLVGLITARKVAKPTPAALALGPAGNIALTVLLALGVLALVIAGEKRPIVALAWAAGIGYAGLAFIELVSTGVMNFSRLFIQAFTRAAIGLAAPAPSDEPPAASEPVNEDQPR